MNVVISPSPFRMNDLENLSSANLQIDDFRKSATDEGFLPTTDPLEIVRENELALKNSMS